MMNSDVATGVLVLLASSGLFLVYILTGPRHGNFPPAPEYVRFPGLVWAGTLVWRGVDFMQIADNRELPGHIDPKGLIATVALVYFVGSVVWCVAARKMSLQSWARIRHAFSSVTEHPDLVPVVMTSHEVAVELRASGTPTVEAGEGHDAVWREGPAHSRHD